MTTITSVASKMIFVKSSSLPAVSRRCPQFTSQLLGRYYYCQSSRLGKVLSKPAPVTIIRSSSLLGHDDDDVSRSCYYGIIRHKSSSTWIPPNEDENDDDDEDNGDDHQYHHQQQRQQPHGPAVTTTTTTTTRNTTRPSSQAGPQSAAVPEVPCDKTHQRIWLPHSAVEPLYWSDAVREERSKPSRHNLMSLLDRIEEQEFEGGRMRDRQYGVLHEDPAVDMRLLTENYTVHSLASALRDREEMLQFASQLAAEGDFKTLAVYLRDCHPNVVLEKRQQRRRLDLQKPLTATSLETIRKGLMRMPRRVTTAHSRRAGVVIPLIHVDGVPSVLLEKRAANLRAHPDEVCLPGGMVCEVSDKTIVETCLREMKEEIGGFEFDYHHETGGSHGVSVLGTLRCNWGEVHHLVGVAVTPVVCFFNQDLAHVDLKPNPDEVAELFTIPLESLLDKKQWVYKDDHAPIFVGGPYVIWGLTGYILERFWKDILQPLDYNSNELHH